MYGRGQTRLVGAESRLGMETNISLTAFIGAKAENNEKMSATFTLYESSAYFHCYTIVKLRGKIADIEKWHNLPNR